MAAGCPRGNIGCAWPLCGCRASAVDVHLPSAASLAGAWRAAAAHHGEPDIVLSYPEFLHWERVIEAARP
jgi:hypothetical protein